MPLSFQGGAIATPAIGRDLAGSAAMVAWITNALMFTFGSLLLTTGSPADRFGRKRIFAGGMMLFVALKPFCAGPTGVELAASIAQLVAATLRKNFRRIDPAKSRIVLLDGGARILPTFAQSLSRKAAKRLTKLGVEVSTGVKVEKV